jgi:hypothetical protein
MKRLLGHVLVVLCIPNLPFIVPLNIFAQANNKDVNFPKRDEIQLVVTQAERAFDQYDRSITLEASLPSAQADKTGIERDRQLLSSAKGLVSGLQKKPDAFHGPGGLLLLGLLDDASRNAALCNGSAFADIADALMSKKGLDRAKAYELMQVGQACQDVSAQLYTVSENVHALLLRELESQQMVNDRATDMITRCTAILKNADTQKPADRK